jgi:hypothetical protein
VLIGCLPEKEPETVEVGALLVPYDTHCGGEEESACTLCPV